MNVIKKLFAFYALALSVVLFGSQIVAPLEIRPTDLTEESTPVVTGTANTTETIQYETAPTDQPDRLRLVPEDYPELSDNLEIELDIDLSRGGYTLASRTPKTIATTVATTKATTRTTTTKATTVATTLAAEKATQGEWMTFTATFYAGDQKGLHPELRTATGTTATAGRTIAVDPKVIPYGTKVYIEGYGYRIAEDCGGFRGTHIDIFVNKISEIPPAGKIKVRIRIVD